MSSITRQTTLTGNIVLFCRFLRSKGYKLGAEDEANAMQALAFLPVNKEHYFQKGLKAVLTKSKYQQDRFDDYYREFWDQLDKAADSKIKMAAEKKNNSSETRKKEAQFESLKNWLNLNPSSEEATVAAPSELEVLTKKNFADLGEEELRLLMRMLQKMARQLAHEKSRLRKPSKKKKQLDLKRTVRLSMRRGGEIQNMIFSEKKERKLKLLLLCDVSKSMDLYSRFFVHLIYAFQNSYDRIETFVFSTALHRVTEILDNHEFDKAFEIISDRIPQWSGGTTIGSCLNDFVHNFGHSKLDKKTIVMILSDGWDTGTPEVMRSAMQAIYKQTKKVIWLNPLAGNEQFSPEAMGMKSAMPYIDLLAAAHNLESLKLAMMALRKGRNLTRQEFLRSS